MVPMAEADRFAAQRGLPVDERPHFFDLGALEAFDPEKIFELPDRTGVDDVDGSFGADLWKLFEFSLSGGVEIDQGGRRRANSLGAHRGDKDAGTQLFELFGANAFDLVEIVNCLKRTAIDNRLRQLGTDSGQRLELFLRGVV